MAISLAIAPITHAESTLNAAPPAGTDALYVVGPAGWAGESQTSDTSAGWGDDQWQVTVATPTTIKVTVTDEYIVGDNYAVYVDGSLIGTTPPVPLYGPTYSSGTFTSPIAAGTHLVTVQDLGGFAYYNQGDTFMIPAGYHVEIAFANATKTVFFVHGWNAPWASNNFDGFLGKVATGANTPVARFEYYQDIGDLSGGSCSSRAAQVPTQPDGGMPADLSSIDGSICDSSSDIGLNAVLLDSDIRAIYEQTGQPVILTGNSMGAAIIRGFLAYSVERNDNVATTMVDSAFFMEGAQSGAYPAKLIESVSGILSPIEQVAKQLGQAQGLPDIHRPAGTELIPQSDWYNWVNPPASHVPALAYYNAFGDLHVAVQSCFLFWCWTTDEPNAKLGDLILTPGVDDPHATPPEGGARFLEGAPGAANWQFALGGTVIWNPAVDSSMVTTLLLDAQTDPVFHGNFGAHMHEISVPDCQTSASTPLDDELVRLIGGRASGTNYACAA